MTHSSDPLTDLRGLFVEDAPEKPETSALVWCRHLTRTYGRGPSAVVAVRDVSCTVRPGEHVALVGPSGSGKSTLLHLMAGLERPSVGTIEWPALTLDSQGRPGPVGVVFQGPSLLPALDVVENVALPLVLAGVAEEEARLRATAALDRLDVGQLGTKWPEELSGGQSQRVAVARVLARRPALILADEPTGQLDATTGAHVIDVLFEAANEIGAALVVSTHDPQVAERLDQRWVLRAGSIVPQTTPTGNVP